MSAASLAAFGLGAVAGVGSIFLFVTGRSNKGEAPVPPAAHETVSRATTRLSRTRAPGTSGRRWSKAPAAGLPAEGPPKESPPETSGWVSPRGVGGSSGGADAPSRDP